MPAPGDVVRAARKAARTAWAAAEPQHAFLDTVGTAVDIGFEAGLKAQILACSPEDLVVLTVDEDWEPDAMRRLSQQLDGEPTRPRVLVVARATAALMHNGQLAFQAGEEVATAKLRDRFIEMLDQHPGGGS